MNTAQRTHFRMYRAIAFLATTAAILGYVGDAIDGSALGGSLGGWVCVGLWAVVLTLLAVAARRDRRHRLASSPVSATTRAWAPTMSDQSDYRPTDGPWTVMPGPAGVWYQVLGEEDDERLMIRGHQVAEDRIAAAIRHAGFGRILTPIEVKGQKIADGLTVADLGPFETWARELRDCPRHGWIPQWLRQWAWQRWEHALEDCSMCTHVVHYRTCQGCGFCGADDSGRVPSCWDWPSTGAAAAHADKAGYIPVSVLDLRG